jgi:hypothetical protein
LRPATGRLRPAFIFSSPIKEGILFSFNDYSPGTKETGTLTIIVIYVMLHIEKGVARKRSAPLFNEVIA